MITAFKDDLPCWPENLDEIVPDILKIHRSEVQLSQPFEEMAGKFSGDPGTVILLSGTQLDCARYNILAANPWLTITAKKQEIQLCTRGRILRFSGDPLAAVNSLISHFALPWAESYSPVSAGLFGYFSYDLKDRIECLPNTCMDQNLPDLYLCAPSTILVHDRHTDTVEQIELTLSYESEEKKSSFYDITSETDPPGTGSFFISPSGFSSTFSKTEYIQAVKRIIEYIKAGDIYQANLSQRFSAGFGGDPYTLFVKLFQKNPAPFFSFINAGDHHVISTSPERFIKRDGPTIETRPIKGTIPRGKDKDNINNIPGKDHRSDHSEDKALGAALLNSLKDDAELSMIVDLMRNDFGKVSIGGTVKVKEHKRLEPYDNVFHLVSVVEAALAPDKSSVDLIRATFPGGSITGCPKIRSMEIIDELESVKRHVYTGSVGYISFHDTLDLSIAIRTAVVANGKIGFSVGGGIVFDSDPEKEYEETLHKGKTLMDTLVSAGEALNYGKTPALSDDYPDLPSTLLEDSSNPLSVTETTSSKVDTYSSDLFFDRKAWVNGKIMDEKKVMVPARFTGFQYGAGLFETIRVQKGKVLRLKEHVERITSSWANLFDETIPELSWQDIIDNLVHLNGLDNRVAAAKLMIARGQRGTDDEPTPSVDGESDFIAVFVRPYTHRLTVKRRKNPSCSEDINGLDLITFPDRRETPLADHKSLNYLYYHLASIFAKKHGCDEAIICNADGTVSETNSTSLISVMGSQVIIPQSDYALPSVTLHAALTLFASAGYELVREYIVPEELCSMENILVLNALMGAVKVLSVDGHKIVHSSNGSDDLCTWLNSGLLIKI